MRRWLLCLFFLSLAQVGLAQLPAPISLQASNGALYGVLGLQLYTYTNGQQTVLNGSAPNDLNLCLERGDGTLLGIGAGGSASWQVVDITLAGAITTLASFPATVTADVRDEPTCPALANDGNYYGTASSGGEYGYGFIYQLTAVGAINIFFNFTGGADGYGSGYPPVQASDGNLYWYTGALLQRYSPDLGLTPTTLSYASDGGTLLEGADGNFYGLGGDGVVQISPQGANKFIYGPPPQDNGVETGTITKLYLTGNTAAPLAALQEYNYQNSDPIDDCSAVGNYYQMLALSLAGVNNATYFSIGQDEYSTTDNGSGNLYTPYLVFDGNGTFYASIQDATQIDEGEFDNCSDNVTNSFTGYGSVPPITMSVSPMHVAPGGSATVTWQATTAYSDTMQQCYGFNGLSGKLAPSGSAKITTTTAGTYSPTLLCGGTEVANATLLAGAATLSLASSVAQVTQGNPVTLTATVTNALTPAPTGKVTFMVGTTVVGSATLVNSVATYTAATTGVPPGTYNVVASYAGDANYGPANSSSVAITVFAKAATTITLMPATQTVTQGATISIDATVTGNSAQGSPSGQLKFLVGSTTVGTAALEQVLGGQSFATFTASTASVAPGTYSVTASYGGDSVNLPSTSKAITVTVVAGTPVSLAISPNPVPADTNFTMTATIHGKDTPTGTVAFYVNGSQDLASGTVSGGVAKVTVPAGTLASGTYQMTAQYAGDSNNPSGTSPAVSLTVQ